MRYAALLRGINVGSGNRIAMADLRSALESAGHGDVRTVLASGNVVFDSPGSSADVTGDLERLLSERFGYSARVIVVPIDTVRIAVDAFPFEESDDQQPYVVFGSTSRVLDDLAEAAPADDADRIQRVGEVLFWTVAKGQTLDSPFGKLLARSQKDDVVTTRNLRTLRKILAAA
ncbi:DUF1697 domain-containing protein [Naasia lichenicola]|uniref:DUF1697 domain-containing protein n=1 Tax=Naasia lichenicola TaxID=2565933 RepID=A0A4S4FJ84_9MICO|nr:DUF1697 domain-containing protein [Naasia lichenicola]THG30158.1 DUF1697 domain-containing protein [Naasia lichenicola]